MYNSSIGSRGGDCGETQPFVMLSIPEIYKYVIVPMLNYLDEYYGEERVVHFVNVRTFLVRYFRLNWIYAVLMSGQRRNPVFLQSDESALLSPNHNDMSSKLQHKRITKYDLTN